MIPLIRVKVRRKATVQGKALVKFPALVSADTPIEIDETGGNRRFYIDMNALASGLLSYFQPIQNIDQEITAGATANVATDAATVRVNKSVGGVITLTLPPAITKTVPVLICDWKGDAGTNNITISPSGSEKIQGLGSWAITSDNGSMYLRPIPGVGYAI
jgi:hypothetical protein